MDNLLREITLANGMKVRFLDNTRRYFGDYYLVTVEIRCEVPILPDYFDTISAYNEVKSHWGETIVHLRKVQQMGVPSAQVSQVRERLIANFEQHSLPYLIPSTMPKKLVLSEINKSKKKTGFLSCTYTKSTCVKQS